MPNRRGRHSSKAAASESESGSDISGDGIRGDAVRRYVAVVRKALAAEAESRIEAGAEVLQCHPGGELDELGVTEVAPDPGGQLLGDDPRAAGCHLGVLEDRSLALVEEVTRSPTADRTHLGRINAGVHPFVVAKVDTPGAADLHGRGFHGKPAQRRIELLPAVLDRRL